MQTPVDDSGIFIEVHACETLQHIVIFHVCLFYEMNSVQHSSATCATHS